MMMMNPATNLLQQWWQEFNATVVLINPAVIFFPLFFSMVYLFKLSTSKRLKFPPSPPKVPLIGNIFQVGRDPHRSFRTLSEKYGPVMLLHFGHTPTLVVSSGEIAREVMQTHEAFIERPRIRVANALFCGCTDVAFCPYGDYWRQAKKICVLELLTQRRVRMFQRVREEEVSIMVEDIRRLCRAGSAVPLSNMFGTTSNNIISRAVLGRVYEREGTGNKSFGELSRKAMDLIGAFCFQDFFPYLGWMDVVTGLTARIESVCSELHSFLDQVIEDHLVAMNDDDKSENKDFVDILLQLQHDGMLDIGLTQDNLKAILLDMFIGGTDNTAATMEWAMAELVKNPSIMKKAQEEVRRVVSERSSNCISTESDVNEMNYLKCVVKETLRLHAPVMVSRQNPKATKLGGYDIPPKTLVLVNAWGIQRDPKLWEKPEEFIPERFLNSSVDFHGQHSQYTPFGGGRRGCPGISFAVAGAEYVLANLLYWFDWKLPDSQRCEDLDMNDYYALIIRKKVPLQLVPMLHSFL